MKVSLITMHKAINYGAVLQTYATVKYLENLNYDVEVIDYIPERFTKKNKYTYVNTKRNKSIFHKVIFILLCLPGRMIHNYIFENFIKKNFNITKDSYYYIDDLRKNTPEADIYLTGSDQVWNSDIEGKVDEAFFLDFVQEGVKKFSYAASFGKDNLEESEMAQIKYLLDKYDAISVREQSGLEILKSIGIKNGKQVLDPTLLLTRMEWEEKTAPRLIKERYLLIYQLNTNNKLVKYANEIAKAKKLKVAKFGWDYIKPKGININLSYRSPEEFLSAVKHSDFVITDSFHGIIFSLIYNKNFICMRPPNYAGRLENILRKINLEKHLIKEELNIDEVIAEIDYSLINNKLEKFRKESRLYLEEALKLG